MRAKQNHAEILNHDNTDGEGPGSMLAEAAMACGSQASAIVEQLLQSFNKDRIC
jgi:hypothetical protein